MTTANEKRSIAMTRRRVGVMREHQRQQFISRKLSRVVRQIEIKIEIKIVKLDDMDQ